MPRPRFFTYLIPYVWRTLWGKAATISFPFGPLSLPSSYRGRVAVDIAACRGCGLCARDCPAGALTVERQGQRGVRIVHCYDRCTSCGQCELGCKDKAIHLEPAFARGEPMRDSLQGEWRKEDGNG